MISLTIIGLPSLLTVVLPSLLMICIPLFITLFSKLIFTIFRREVESFIRILKSDLDLRPVFHKTDETTRANIHLGLMAYWVVNAIRHQLKYKEITSDWRELVRMMNTQNA
jgi:hypothetical protein